jgi:ABC-2 type transport system permease protein
MRPSRAVRLVAAREVREGLRNRTFVITFVVALVAIVGGILVPTLLAGGDDAVPVGIVGPSLVDTAELEAVAARFELDLDVAELSTEREGVAAVRDGELRALLVDDQRLIVEQEVDPTLRAVISEVVAQHTAADRLQQLGVDAEDAAAVLAAGDPVVVETLEEPTDGTAIGFAVGGTVLLLMAVTFFASAVLTGVVEEKASRVVEVVLGAMRPWQLLAGKLLGLGSLAFGQVTILLLAAYTTIVLSGAFDLPDTTVATLAGMIGWFALGFAFYSVVYAAAGALVNRVEDAQSSAGPIGMVIFAAYIATFAAVLPDPESTVSRVLSQIPGFSPLTMPARVALGAVTGAEMALAVALSLAATVVAVLGAGRIYERSLLQTGQMKWREALRRQPAGA